MSATLSGVDYSIQNRHLRVLEWIWELSEEPFGFIFAISQAKACFVKTYVLLR